MGKNVMTIDLWQEYEKIIERPIEFVQDGKDNPRLIIRHIFYGTACEAEVVEKHGFKRKMENSRTGAEGEFLVCSTSSDHDTAPS